MISDEDVCRYFQLVKSKLEEDSIQTTFFEITTAMMFLYFSDKNCDYVVLETGLGGRYDARITSYNVCYTKLLRLRAGL